MTSSPVPVRTDFSTFLYRLGGVHHLVRASGRCVLCLAYLSISSLHAMAAQDVAAKDLARQDVPGEPVLTTTRAAHQLSIKEAKRGYPVRLHGVVTYYDPYLDPRQPVLFVTDATGSVFVSLATIPAAALKAGDVVDVTGVSGAGDFAPIVERARVISDEHARVMSQGQEQSQAGVMGASSLPRSAPRVSMADLLTSEQDGQWVEVEAVVHAVRQTTKNVFLDLVLRDGVLGAATTKPADAEAGGLDYASLVDARILLRGNAAPLFNHQGQLTGAHMLFPGVAALSIEQAAPANPFALPLERVGSLLRYQTNTALHHRVHLRGTVTLLWPGRLLCIEDGAQGLCAQTSQATPLRPGQMIDLIGFPTIGDFTPSLANATYQLAAEYGAGGAVDGLPVTASEALWGNHDAQLVAIEGQLIGEDRAASDPTIVLSNGKFIFSAVLPKHTSHVPPDLKEGSWVRLTGICSLQSDGAVTTDFPVARSFRISLRSAADIVVVRPPSWWTAAHTLRILVLALVLTLATLARVIILRQRVNEQSLTIRESEERFRRLATQDGLTQLPNRNAILAMLAASLDRAGAEQAHVCVAILDLDHFKQINDTFGHQAGDEVLQQTAHRLSFSIRNTDAIGRYGGEEFLIVFRNADQEIGIERSERIRNAICGEPVTFDDRMVSISCSIGIASTRDARTSATALISQADDALYRAKARGRNRVECFSVPFPELETPQA